jgi:hypothetical protein
MPATILGDPGCEPFSFETATSEKVFRVLRVNGVRYAKSPLDDFGSPHQALQLWSGGLFLAPKKIEKCNIVDTPFHGFHRFVARWVCEAASPYIELGGKPISSSLGQYPLFDP